MIVIDTSVAFKWFDKSEDNFEKARDFLKRHLLKEDEIIVPDLFFYELANAWSTKSHLETEDIKENLKLLEKYSLKMVSIDIKYLEKAVIFARQHSTTVYDAIYAIIAQERKCLLVTADEKFISNTRQSYIKKLVQ